MLPSRIAEQESVAICLTFVLWATSPSAGAGRSKTDYGHRVISWAAMSARSSFAATGNRAVLLAIAGVDDQR